jgi:glycosyltransferase involved in cell wall biosynthesis
MEAMNACLPIVATDVGDNSRLVRDGVNGRLVPVGDERTLATALLELIGSPQLRADQGAESHGILAREYSFEAFRRAYARILDGEAPRAPSPPETN